jgi:hypothetical protein
MGRAFLWWRKGKGIVTLLDYWLFFFLKYGCSPMVGYLVWSQVVVSSSPTIRTIIILFLSNRGWSLIGRTSALQAERSEFDPHHLHQKRYWSVSTSGNGKQFLNPFQPFALPDENTLVRVYSLAVELCHWKAAALVRIQVHSQIGNGFSK